MENNGKKITYEILREDPTAFSLGNHSVMERVIIKFGESIVATAPLVKDNSTKIVYLGHVAVESKFNIKLDEDEHLQDEFANCLNRLGKELNDILKDQGYSFGGPSGGTISTENKNVNKRL